jgi:hypothetical protein
MLADDEDYFCYTVNVDNINSDKVKNINHSYFKTDKVLLQLYG